MLKQTPTTVPSHLICFLRDCYEADNRETALFDLRHDKVQHLHLLTQGGEFLTGTLDVVPVERTSALELQKSARLFEAEKTLVFGAFLLVGKLRQSTPPLPKEIFAPLLTFPAAVEEAGSQVFLRVDPRGQRVNAKVLAALLGESESASPYLDEILGRIPQVPFQAHQIQDLIAAFEEFLPAVDGGDLVQFAHVAARPGLNLAGCARAAIRCLPAYAMALTPNSPETRGVLTELAQMAATPHWSPPLRMLADATAPVPKQARRQVHLQVPASLSAAQEKALLSAVRHPLTLVVGPPGTGKSYTVAAMALDHVLRGRSVLIAAKTDQALNVLADKIEALMGRSRFVLRGGRAGYTRQLKHSLSQWLQGLEEVGDEERATAEAVRRLGREVLSHSRRIGRLETVLSRRAEWEIQWGRQAAGPASLGRVSRWLRSCRLRLVDWQLALQDCYWNVMGHYQSQLQARHASMARLLRASIRHRVEGALERHRKEFVKLSNALRARTNRRQEEWFAQIDLDLLLRVFPVWMTTLADVGDLLPLKPALFDLAIIDEATQCDMASALPVLFRARRAAVTGDPRQLRHLSFLSGERQRLLAGKWELSSTEQERCDYRDKSLLDWVSESISSQVQVAFLDEHFRSRPQIIAFSNREFYQNALKIMTTRPDTLAQPSVVLRHVDGVREGGGPNPVEAEELVAELAGRVEAEKELPAAVIHSLGVLSPFRDQVDYLSARLSKRLGLAALERHRVRVGTAHSFQGEERDIMFLSWVVDREAHPASLRYLDRPDVFNVSVTRARNLQVVFCSIGPEDLPAGSLLRRYLEAIGSPSAGGAASPATDSFLREVQESLIQAGYQVWPCYVVAGLTLDLLVEKGGRSLGIDLVGHPGQFSQAFDLEKYRLLERAGLPLFPLSLSAWRHRQPACLEAIAQWMQRE